MIENQSASCYGNRWSLKCTSEIELEEYKEKIDQLIFIHITKMLNKGGLNYMVNRTRQWSTQCI